MVLNLDLFSKLYKELPQLWGCDDIKLKQVCDELMSQEDFYEVVSGFVKNKNRVLDLCCGKPEKIREIASHCLDCKFIGIDINPGMGRYYCGENLTFSVGDISKPLKIETDGVVALHACGDLADRSLEISLQLDAPLLVVPCCYAKIGAGINRPISRLFSNLNMRDSYSTLIRSAKRLENSPVNSRYIAKIIRALFNYDRMARAEEVGRKARLIEIKDLNSPHNLAVVVN